MLAALSWSAVGTGLAIAASIGAGVAYLRASLSKSTIELYKADNDALRGRVGTLEGDNARLAGDIASCLAGNALLKDRNAQLVELLTGRAELAALADQLGQHHDQVLRELRLVRAAVGK